jgi:hypothetical protein
MARVRNQPVAGPALPLEIRTTSCHFSVGNRSRPDFDFTADVPIETLPPSPPSLWRNLQGDGRLPGRFRRHQLGPHLHEICDA